MPNYQFGTGLLYGNPNAGNQAANPTPYLLGILQEAQIDVKGDIKKLYGQFQMALASARGKIDVTVKGKFATQDVTLLNQLYWGQTQTPGINQMATNEPWTIGGGSPPTATVTVDNAANFLMDWGVINANTGQQFTAITSGTPAVSQYKVNSTTGVYTFSAADEAALTPVYISYTWTNVSRGATVALKNQFMGYAPLLRMYLVNMFRNQYFGIELYAVTMGSFSVPTKMEDFWISDVDFDATCDNTGTLGQMYADLG
jgi:hypothetical protein